ncbi:nucleotidyltransferase family protein [Reichenbachiella agarivorans]|uniref:Nucleotidyltransferase family protein n=1 Tax=Reichenbachiella agarivorans TaxID=2979464 RepID=A0ABY6CQ64_9BACT|nr:nucleotidyltransferase family protein [Reichenbachiella agarivorans]UXP32658.1 nucleotidyltransferase family protein [Reichenbachiella agarivorans]
MKSHIDFWPSSQQLFLLKACTLSGTEAISNFEKWQLTLVLNPQKTGDQLLATVFDQIDGGSQRLLPLLHYNLHLHLPDDPILKAIKGYNRYVWSKNQIIFFQVKKIINLLDNHQIEHFFVKGVPLAKHYYGSDGIRPMSDLDIVVHESDVHELWDLLSQEGWKDLYSKQYVDTKRLVGNSRCLINNKKDEIDTHWRVFKDSFSEHDEIELWEDLALLEIDGMKTKMLNPTFQLLHTIIHGMRWNELPSFRWICDSMIIIKTDSINWEQLLSFSEKRKYSLRISAALSYLRDEFDAVIPDEVFDRLNNIKVSSIEKKFFNKLTTKHEARSLSNVLLRHYQFKLYHANNNVFNEIWVYLNHHKTNWGTKNVLASLFSLIGHKMGLTKHPLDKLK